MNEQNNHHLPAWIRYTLLIGSPAIFSLSIGMYGGLKKGYEVGRFDERTAHYVMHNVPEANGLDIIIQSGKDETKVYVINPHRENSDSPFWEDRYDHVTGIDANNDGRVESTQLSIEPAEFLRRYQTPEERKTLDALAGFNNANDMTEVEQLALKKVRSEK
jgi:hypothetical protein